jgi:hypothetical protein
MGTMTDKKKENQNQDTSNGFEPIFAPALFSCPGCAGSLALIDVKESSLVAVMQCTECRAQFHGDLEMDIDKDFQIIPNSIRRGA